ncbi:hypothetical protein [Neorhizobium sp. NCHU2750]|uniref:hypothetical protein n=1 Tax=Neorhizobium sp. NCHU2750 TaxID=1825976 RepID=UPI000E770C45|nr:hypothetical protein NCHU2750_30370 [Neorhizobium sp. NCHU2750]
MQHILAMLRNRFFSRRRKPVFETAYPENVQVIIPDAVVLPLPKAPREEISVPASINGRDLSTGRL